MQLPNTTEPVPFAVDPEGVVRIGGTRVTLDTVVAAFAEGATPEEIVQQYPTLALADVYAVLSYYLRQPEAVEAYLKERQAQAGKVRRENERRFGPHGLRERLVARRSR